MFLNRSMLAGLLCAATLIASAGVTAVAQNRYSAPLPGGKVRLTLTLVSPEILRVQITPSGANVSQSPVQIVRPQPACKDRFTPAGPAREPGYSQINTSLLQIDVPGSELPANSGVIVRDRSGKVLFDASAGCQIDGSTHRIVQLAKLTEGDNIFGGGLQFHSMAQTGKSKTLKVNADPKDDSGNSHAVTPFFLSTRGWGLFLNTTSYSQFDFGKTVPGQMQFSSPDPELDYYLFYGPTLREVVSRYTQLTGRMQMPPRWGLGFWYRMKSDWKADKATEVAAKFRSNGIACDVLGLEPAWQTHAYSCSYVWNKAQFPDPAGYVKSMRNQGFHLNLWEHAYVHPSSPIHSELKTKGLAGDKEVWGGLVPDFTKAETVSIFKSLHKSEHIDLGVDGYKLDECDGSDYTGGWFFPDDAKFPSGITGAQMHNVFGYLYQRAFHEMFESLGMRGYFLCRGSYAGGQAYPTVIYSDWYDFKDYVRAACNSGFSGQLWCPEVRQTESTEEFVRRFQTMFFSPLAMINAWADGVTPWEKGPEVERIFRKYDDLRMQLIPELYSAFRQMSKTGIPVIRPLALDWPTDPHTFSIDDEFMFGDSILVAPIFKGEKRTIYLPAGEWADWWTGRRVRGAQSIEVNAPLDTLPLYVKVGGVVTLQPPMQHSDAVANFPLEISIILPSAGGAAASSSVIYDDDGTSLNYRTGQYLELPIQFEQHGKTVTLTLGRTTGNASPRWSTYLLHLKGAETAPKSVWINGRSITEYHYDAVTRSVEIPLASGFRGTAVLRF
jgi:alpha-glucosidase (family GH31 glycosyl hydrolase)